VRGARSREAAAEQKARRVGVVCGEFGIGGGELVWRLGLAAWFGALVWRLGLS
jgi:hypothetical protein